MAVRYYDEALFNKIKRWVKDPHMQILRPDETTRLFEIEADTNRDKTLQLPVIALTRNADITLQNTQKQPRSFNAAPIKVGGQEIQDFTRVDLSKVDSDVTTLITLNTIPMTLNYQLDIYTKGMIEADEYMRNFVFNFINYPKMVVELPYLNLNIQCSATVSLDPEITDNSGVREHLFPDEFVRFTLRLHIDDAYLFSVPEQEVPRLTTEGVDSTGESFEGLFEVQDRQTAEIVETHTLF